MQHRSHAVGPHPDTGKPVDDFEARRREATAGNVPTWVTPALHKRPLASFALAGGASQVDGEAMGSTCC